MTRSPARPASVIALASMPALPGATLAVEPAASAPSAPVLGNMMGGTTQP